MALFPTNPSWVPVTGTVENKGDAMWIKTDAKDCTFVDARKLDTIYACYSMGTHKVVGTIGDRDVLIRAGFGHAKAAADYVEQLIKQIS